MAYVNKIKKGNTTYDIQDGRVPEGVAGNFLQALGNNDFAWEKPNFLEDNFKSHMMSVEQFYQNLSEISELYSQGKIKLMFIDSTKGKGYELQLAVTFGSGMQIAGVRFFYFDEEGTHQEMTSESVGIVTIFGYIDVELPELD